MLVDSHCHLDRLNKSKSELKEVIKNANAKGVEHFLCVCVSVNDYTSMMDMIDGLPNVYATCGVHPLHQDEACTKQELHDTANSKEVVAIGETGLDYFYSPESKEVQVKSFIEHIQVANELQKPLVIHTRDAREDTISLLKKHGGEQCGGVLHCFTENWEMAKAAIDLGFYISISGIVTFRNASELREVVKKVPLDRLLVETDSPWLAPVPHRGKQNEPAFVKEVAQFIADLKQIPLEKLAQVTTENFFELFPLTRQQV
ncbi:TatD family hydrolase [Planctobacterium marinum]|uniref:DNAse n=1 Tax=Planctobacterium marinum TaxID=1631968 RepID=A0AA48HXX7_9ALTE|nr:DNAse [Planctobacterium marinum]